MTNSKIEINFKDYLSEIYDQPKKLHEAYRVFHRYSAKNRILAENQLSVIEPINTYNGWKELGRQVKKGSKAISLFLPVIKKIEDSEVDKKNQDNVKNTSIDTTQFIRKKHWFSLSQTEGKEFESEKLPNFEFKKAFKILEITQERFQMLNGNCQGYAIPDQNIIAINPLAYAPYKTTIHEIAHCLLHKESKKIIDGEELDSSIKEFEAETTAYLVCCSLGKFEHLEYSRGYIANWIKRDDAKENNFKRAFEAANIIMSAGLIQGEG